MTHDNLTLHDVRLMLDAAERTAEGRENAWALWSYSELCRLAMLAIDPQAERDRRVGAAVRACAPDSFDLATTLSEAARELDRDDVQFPIAAGALRAIAAALREEAGR